MAMTNGENTWVLSVSRDYTSDNYKQDICHRQILGHSVHYLHSILTLQSKTPAINGLVVL